jgi:intracellular sulfur oxidation DsrE/DsrF family protein
MNRRNAIWAAFASIGAGFAAGSARAQGAAKTQDRMDTAEKPKVVYHLNELERVAFVLGNIQNHFDGMGGPDKVTIALVVHGPALKAFHAATAPKDISSRVGAFEKAGIAFAACGNTMKAQNVTLADLLPGFVTADRGGVVRIAELQGQGYAYLRP